MFLVRLVYASTVSEHFQSSDIENILSFAKQNNARNGVSGMLCFNHKYFLQCLEGSRAKVNDTYNLIARDPRHNNIVLLDYQTITKREFSGWSMGYVPASVLALDITFNYSTSNDFNPYEMSGESAYQMLLTLRTTVPAI